MMAHPFHLHGFFFQVLEINGENLWGTTKEQHLRTIVHRRSEWDRNVTAMRSSTPPANRT
jgi:FtsP/CotA-like multicopper oxidase with cupredoxin domain